MRGGVSATAAPSPYRWLILLLIWFANTSGALIQLSGAPVKLTVAADFHLSAAQIATWINLAGIAASPMLGSILGDFNAATARQFLIVWLILAAVMLGLSAGASQLTETGWKMRLRSSASA